MEFKYKFNTMLIPIIIAILIFSISGCDETVEKAKESSVTKTGGYDNAESSVGRFTINNTTFEVPRKYIPFNANQENGNVGAINLRYFLPNFISESDRNSDDRQEYLRNVVHVLVKECDGVKCKEISYINFKNTIKLRGDIDSGCLQGEETKLEGTNLKSYIINSTNSRKSEREIFIYGDQCNPEFYLVCGTNNSEKYPSCKRWFHYRDNILINYIFRKIHLKNYLAIENSLISKLDEYASDNME